MTKLRLASDLTLPADLATHVTLIAGKRGSGKTNTAKRLVEQLHRAHVPFGVLDPVDVWWGLKAGRDGTKEGGLDGIFRAIGVPYVMPVDREAPELDHMVRADGA